MHRDLIYLWSASLGIGFGISAYQHFVASISPEPYLLAGAFYLALCLFYRPLPTEEAVDK